MNKNDDAGAVSRAGAPVDCRHGLSPCRMIPPLFAPGAGPAPKNQNNISPTPGEAAPGGRLQVGTAAAFKLECLAGFVGIRNAPMNAEIFYGMSSKKLLDRIAVGL